MVTGAAAWWAGAIALLSLVHASAGVLVKLVELEPPLIERLVSTARISEFETPQPIARIPRDYP